MAYSSFGNRRWKLDFDTFGLLCIAFAPVVFTITILSAAVFCARAARIQHNLRPQPLNTERTPLLRSQEVIVDRAVQHRARRLESTPSDGRNKLALAHPIATGAAFAALLALGVLAVLGLVWLLLWLHI